MSELEDGLFAVNFVAKEGGIHIVSVQNQGVEIPGSPFDYTVGPLQGGGASKVHAGGPGLDGGIQGNQNGKLFDERREVNVL